VYGKSQFQHFIKTTSARMEREVERWKNYEHLLSYA
jgi:hypothetical protein